LRFRWLAICCRVHQLRPRRTVSTGFKQIVDCLAQAEAAVRAASLIRRKRTRLQARAADAGFSILGPYNYTRSVLILQHPDSFEWENPWKHKNAAIADGFGLLVFLNMDLAHIRRRRATAGGT
jgi:hypothetical protein